MDNDNQRDLEPGIHRSPKTQTSYGGYLRLDRILNAQQSLTACHDEMLFIIQHQVSELWLRLMIHELRAAINYLVADKPNPALKVLARVKRVQQQLFGQWAVLETMTPHDYLSFRDQLSSSSGLHSAQYRMVEFILGNKQAEMLAMFDHDPAMRQTLADALHAPSLYDVFLHHLARCGHAVPQTLLRRDFSQPHRRDQGLLPVFKRIYQAPSQHWSAHNLCESLVDVEENFQMWRFRHMKAVERIIGHRRGTGGSSGVGFLKQALDLTFFPELLDVRGELGR